MISRNTSLIAHEPSQLLYNEILIDLRLARPFQFVIHYWGM